MSVCVCCDFWSLPVTSTCPPLYHTPAGFSHLQLWPFLKCHWQLKTTCENVYFMSMQARQKGHKMKPFLSLSLDPPAAVWFVLQGHTQSGGAYCRPTPGVITNNPLVKWSFSLTSPVLEVLTWSSFHHSLATMMYESITFYVSLWLPLPEPQWPGHSIASPEVKRHFCLSLHVQLHVIWLNSQGETEHQSYSSV